MDKIQKKPTQKQTTPNAGEAVKQQELSHVADGGASGMATLENSAAVCYKTKHTLTI